MQPTNRQVEVRNQPLRMRDLLRRLRKVHSSVDYISFDLLHQEKHYIACFLVWNIKQKGRMRDVVDYIYLSQIHSWHICCRRVIVIFGESLC
jgi:hypothetical protein